MNINFDTTPDNTSTPRRLRLGLLLAALMAVSQSSFAWDYDFRGYLGYAAVDTDQDIECNNRACQGVLADSLFYGLSASISAEHLGAQVVVTQDTEEDPDISLAQLTWQQSFMNMDLRLRGGKIIVPLGLYGSQRITPTTQPGLVLPQSFLLNAYYDLLTLSENGIGVDLRGSTWGFKAAIFEPEEVTVQQITVIPGTPGPLDFLLGGLLGLDFLTGIGGTPPQVTTTTQEHDNEAAYLGVDYRDGDTQVDVGWVRQELQGVTIDAYNLGVQWKIGNFQPSMEAFQFDVKEIDSSIEGISLNLMYSAEKWQTFISGVTIEIGDSNADEVVLGGVYYWDTEGRFSTRATWRRLDGDFPGVTQGADKTDAYGLAVGYSWD